MNEQLDKAELGRARVAARARRLAAIRSRVITLTVAAFALLSGGIGLGEISGTGNAPSAAATASASPDDSVETDDGAAILIDPQAESSSQSSPAAPVSPAPMVTQQS